MKTYAPLITVVVPSYNQAEFLEVAIKSVFDQSVAVEAIVVDGGSTDKSPEVIKKFEHNLYWWRSRKDDGQAAAVNEGIAKGTAPYVCWLNSDDLYLPGGLLRLIEVLKNSPSAPAAYGRCLVVDKMGKKKKMYWTARFTERHLANRCFIAQPATLIRRSAWEQVGGLDDTLHMSMDYDLWWRLYKKLGELRYTKDVVAASRYHGETKTNLFRRAHYCESKMIVQKYYGKIPLKWHIAWPIKVLLWDYYNRVNQYIKKYV
jgi:glycosyltransferase involved in cell wall biosynthesis